MHSKLSFVMALGALLAVNTAVQTARADTIDFDSEGLTGPSQPAQSQTISVNTSIGAVTFSGGALAVQPETLTADKTTVYYDGAMSLPFAYNPITVTFPTAVTNFSVDIYNLEASPETFTLTDNLGYTASQTIANNASGSPLVLSLPEGGSTVTIDAASTTGFDFAIDDISFTPPGGGSSNDVPEPATLALLGVGLAGLGMARRRRA